MIEVIKEATPLSRKFYDCDACLFITNCDSLNDFAVNNNLTFTECRALVRAKQAGFKIKPGIKYIKQVNKMEGRVYTFRAIPEIHAIAIKCDVYSDCC